MASGKEWQFRYTSLFGQKVWLDPENKKILLAGSFGGKEKVFDYQEIRSIRFTGSYCTLNTSNNNFPSYGITFWLCSDKWQARLENEFDLV